MLSPSPWNILRSFWGKQCNILDSKDCCCSVVQLFATPRTTAPQDSLSFIIYWGLLKFMSIQLVMLSNHLILRFLICNSESLLVHKTSQALNKSGWEKEGIRDPSRPYRRMEEMLHWVITIWQKTQDDKDRHRLLCKNKRGALPETGAQEVPSEHVTTEQDFGYKEKRLTRARR